MVTPRGHDMGATASDYTWTYGYDADGNQTSAAHPDGGTSHTTYDALNRPTQYEDADSHTTDLAYDANGNITRQTQDLGEHVDFTYDGENRRPHTNRPARQRDRLHLPAHRPARNRDHARRKPDQLHPHRRRPDAHHGHAARKRLRRHARRLHLDVRVRPRPETRPRSTIPTETRPP